MEYMNTKQAANLWGISERRVRKLCSEGQIEGTKRVGRAWLIPDDTQKPADQRIKQNDKYVFSLLNDLIYSEKQEEQLMRINDKLSRLNSLRPLTPGEVARLREEFLIEFTYDSNAIEGNSLTLQETALVIKEGITIDQKPLKDHLEVVGHKDAYEYVLQLIQDQIPFSERIIKEIHTLVLMNQPQDRGVYRRVPVRIVGASHEPPQPYLVPIQMEQLLMDYPKVITNMHPVVSVAVFHLLFEGIHPFIDGNGRTGRLILNFELLKHGFPPINIKFADRKKYYYCFNEFYETKNPETMVQLVADYVEKELDRYIEILTL
jgi:excisionase family DNA binding protein